MAESGYMSKLSKPTKKDNSVHIYAGIDGGGTSTRICVIDDDGNVLARDTFASINSHGSGTNNVLHVCEQLASVIDRVELPGKLKAMTYSNNDANSAEGNAAGRTTDGEAREAIQCRGILMGAAGYNEGEQGQIFKEILGSGRYGALNVVSDCDPAFSWHFKDGEGILLIAGTGSICMGRKSIDQSIDRSSKAGTVIGGSKPDVYITGGCSHTFADEGSGYDIGRQMIRSIIYAHDGRRRPTVLTDMVYKERGLGSFEDFFAFIHDTSVTKSEIADMSKLLDDAVGSGDEAAARIAEYESDELSDLVCTVIRRMDASPDVKIAFHGGVVQHDTIVSRLAEKKIKAKYPDVSVTREEADCALEAAYMARNMFA